MQRSDKKLPDPRFWNYEQCAARLSKSVGWFRSHRVRLEQLGMPRRDDILQGWDSKAFEAWLDARSNILTDAMIEDEIMNAIRGK
jgi:hypothetical protein